MIYIAICDDEMVICNEIAESIKEYHKNSLEMIDIKIYTEGESLYDDLLKGNLFDLIFLDIELYKLNGIEIGYFIRNNLDNQLTQIVYISSKQKYAMDLFTIHPLDFLIKPIESLKIIQCIELTLKMRQREQEYFFYEIKNMKKKIPLSEIYYFESDSRKVKIHFTGGEDEFYGRLNEIYEKLQHHSFLYIHKSYIVNYLWVKVNTSKEMVLENGKKLSVSRANQKQVLKKISEMKMDGENKWK